MSYAQLYVNMMCAYHFRQHEGFVLAVDADNSIVFSSSVYRFSIWQLKISSSEY